MLFREYHAMDFLSLFSELRVLRQERFARVLVFYFLEFFSWDLFKHLELLSHGTADEHAGEGFGDDPGLGFSVSIRVFHGAALVLHLRMHHHAHIERDGPWRGGPDDEILALAFHFEFYKNRFVGDGLILQL